ncbi:MAG: hypothetical protein KAW17_00670 [Candidatus Eisenbacteria sp.]|nr:hypothetical protein [Candidatus Eisenbacteria bacterium]
MAGSMSAGREFASHLRLIGDAIEAAGFEVLSKPVLDPADDLANLTLEKHRHIFRRDLDWIAGSVAMIAEVSTPSFGVGYEISEALHCAKPVLCLRHESLKGKILSALIYGNTSPFITVRHYDDHTVAELVREFLAALFPL